MNDNGTFRKKNGFTIAGNTLTRDKKLSLKAKGLYLLIASYITFEDIMLTKSFIFSMCVEKEKAFETVWGELKEEGYLKVYMKPSSKGWSVEYELLDEPKKGAHTFYLNSNGEITCTNLDRKKGKEERYINTPQKGGNAVGDNVDGCNGDGYEAQGYSAEIGNNINNTNNNLSNKTIKEHSFFHKKETERIDDEIEENVEEEIDRTDGIPYYYHQDNQKMTSAIQYLTDWKYYYPNGYQDKMYQQTYNLAVDALIEMACESEIKTYNQRKISYVNVIDKINQAIAGQECKSIHAVIEGAIGEYILAASKQEIKYPKNYIKACILDSFDTWYMRLDSLLNRSMSIV